MCLVSILVILPHRTSVWASISSVGLSRGRCQVCVWEKIHLGSCHEHAIVHCVVILCEQFLHAIAPCEIICNFELMNTSLSKYTLENVKSFCTVLRGRLLRLLACIPRHVITVLSTFATHTHTGKPQGKPQCKHGLLYLSGFFTKFAVSNQKLASVVVYYRSSSYYI